VTADDFEKALRPALADNDLSRRERSAVLQLLAAAAPDEGLLASYRKVAFKIAREAAADPAAREIIDMLDEVNSMLIARRPITRAYFSPGENCANQIVQLFERARRTCDLCIFTITDDRIAKAIVRARDRGVRIRIISDLGKCDDTGSDIPDLRELVRVTTAPCDGLMHHKFALFDDERVLTGSYNWTYSAATANYENVVVTNDASTVRQFREEFENLWQALGERQTAATR